MCRKYKSIVENVLHVVCVCETSESDVELKSRITDDNKREREEEHQDNHFVIMWSQFVIIEHWDIFVVKTHLNCTKCSNRSSEIISWIVQLVTLKMLYWVVSCEVCDIHSSNVQIEGLKSTLNTSVIYFFIKSSMMIEGGSKNRRWDQYFESLMWEEWNKQWLTIEQNSRD